MLVEAMRVLGLFRRQLVWDFNHGANVMIIYAVALELPADVPEPHSVLPLVSPNTGNNLPDSPSARAVLDDDNGPEGQVISHRRRSRSMAPERSSRCRLHASSSSNRSASMESH